MNVLLVVLALVLIFGGFFADAGDQWIARRRLARRGVHVARDLDAVQLLRSIRDREAEL